MGRRGFGDSATFKVTTVRMSADLSDRVKRYAAETGTSEGAAIRALIEKGLMEEGLNLYASPLGKLIEDIAQQELESFRAELELRSRDIEDRLARVCSKGSRSAVQACIMLSDCMVGLFPAMSELSAETVFTEYSHQAGQLQHNVPFAQIRKDAGDEA